EKSWTPAAPAEVAAVARTAAASSVAAAIRARHHGRPRPSAVPLVARIVCLRRRTATADRPRSVVGVRPSYDPASAPRARRPRDSYVFGTPSPDAAGVAPARRRPGRERPQPRLRRRAHAGERLGRRAPHRHVPVADGVEEGGRGVGVLAGERADGGG